MRCAAALSTTRDSEAALGEVVDRLAEAFGGEPADLAVVFASMHHAEALGRVGAELTGPGPGPPRPGLHRGDDHRRGPRGRGRAGPERLGDPAPGGRAQADPDRRVDDGLDALEGLAPGPARSCSWATRSRSRPTPGSRSSTPRPPASGSWAGWPAAARSPARTGSCSTARSSRTAPWAWPSAAGSRSGPWSARAAGRSAAR